MLIRHFFSLTKYRLLSAGLHWCLVYHVLLSCINFKGKPAEEHHINPIAMPISTLGKKSPKIPTVTKSLDHENHRLPHAKRPRTI